MNTKLFLLGALAITGAAIFFLGNKTENSISAHDLAVTRFSEFRVNFGKDYQSDFEQEYRFQVFNKNLKTIEEHNKDASQTYTLAVNKFSDLTFEEFSAKYLGLSEHLKGTAKCERSGLSFEDVTEDEVDWVARGVVHPPKDQAQCGSCWAFATVAALESAYAIFKKQTVDISEQQLVDCSSSYGNHGCNGGLMSFAYDYILDHKLVAENDYPYTARTGKCNSSIQKKGVYGIKGCKNVAKGVKNIIPAAAQQPVAVAFYVQADFQSYHSGVYSPKRCLGQPNHAVTVVGYSLKGSNPYLYVKNSWGKGWGDKGYFKIAMGSNNGTCNIGGHTWNYYPVV